MQNPNSRRKEEHLRICLEKQVEASGLATGFERVRLLHRALPELSLEEIDTSVELAGKVLAVPFVISAMTGGTPEAAAINRNLAAAAQEVGAAMIVGSQRAAIEQPDLAASYQVRDVAPGILLFANLGAVQLNYGYTVSDCRRAVEMIGADGLALHLNPLQECLQPEGNRDFRNLKEKIGTVVRELGYPVLVKEVGWGISGEVALELWDAGVRLLDVAGAGGTCWSEVEAYRAQTASARRMARAFRSWGIPTAEAVSSVLEATPEMTVIASGGIRSGVDVAKAIALGATAAGLALPLLAPACRSAAAVVDRLRLLQQELRVAMFCTGSRDLKSLRRALWSSSFQARS